MESSTLVALIVALIVAVGIALGIYLLVRARRKAQARLALMSPEERELHDATVEYDARVKEAQKALTVEEKARAKRLDTAQKAISKASSIGKRKLGSYKGKEGSISFTESTITTPSGTYPLDESVTAAADTAGNLATSSRSTLTRIAAGGLVFGPVGAIVGGAAKKTEIHDSRELYLLVQGAQFAAVLTCEPDDGPKVRQFAMAIVQAGRNVNALLASRDAAVEAALVARDAEVANTAPVEAARGALALAQVATARREAAQAQLLAIATATPATPEV